ncbi:MAG: alpha/beta hydrolase [Rikenellaceae bacterium]|nr:alpha/beta hydrolase [Rikenellaceae bacterium]
MKTHLGLVLLFLFPGMLSAQEFFEGIPRDTSFTVWSAYRQEIQKYPRIRIVPLVIPAGIVVKQDIVYSVLSDTPYGRRELHLDIYRPDNRLAYPALLMIHGGGWNSGDRSMEAPMAAALATRGYVCIPVEYRLSPEALYPAAIYDVKAAIRWVRAHAADLGIDPNRIAVSGDSAGGLLADLAGATNGNPHYEGEGGYSHIPSTVQAVVDLDGVADLAVPARTERARKAREAGRELPGDARWLGGTYEESPAVWQAVSPARQLSLASAPVCFINSSNRDHPGLTVQVGRMKALDIPYELHTIPDTPHPFWLFDPWFGPTIELMAAFLCKTFGSDLSSSPPHSAVKP